MHLGVRGHRLDPARCRGPMGSPGAEGRHHHHGHHDHQQVLVRARGALQEVFIEHRQRFPCTMNHESFRYDRIKHTSVRAKLNHNGPVCRGFTQPCLAQCVKGKCLPRSYNTLCSFHEFLGNRRRPSIYGAVFAHKVMATVTATICPYHSYGSPRIAVTRRTFLPVTRMCVNPTARKIVTISLTGAALPVSITKRPPGRSMRAASRSAPLFLPVKAGNGTRSKNTVRN
jgi:hypothetical protein